MERSMSSRRTFAGTMAAAAAFALAASSLAQQAADSRRTRRRIIVFDVNETMLDVNALESHFARAFGDGRVLREWFSTVLLYSNVATVAGPYSDFGAIAGAALDMVAEARQIRLPPDDRQSILSGMRTLPAHPDVRPALQQLREAGFRLVTLTNSAPAVAAQQMKAAGLDDLFERSFSVDSVQRFKPAPEPYLDVARQLQVAPRDLRMVAAHAWDIVGALRAGCAAAFVARPGKVLYPLGPQPDIVAPDMATAARLIASIDAG
jgi:2-haloacid dehalogenase